MSTENLKKELEATLLITKWSPTESDLKEIARRLKGLKGSPSKSDVEKVVHDVVGSYECMILEGVDNTDLTTLLILATKATENDD
ncbi:hypothetical protein LDJ79_08070 [Vibrio tritonius]|uniref:Uncharacterized protein n=1 Tax=Vibrio tritonius TaxID=1435069 RepID=A0ABS7YL43_9VIBR|nr:hypothetical protein [Vibrio tritonius]MCA2016063.1 hypothetical protein [Vibrio tritonius]